MSRPRTKKSAKLPARRAFTPHFFVPPFIVSFLFPPSKLLFLFPHFFFLPGKQASCKAASRHYTLFPPLVVNRNNIAVDQYCTGTVQKWSSFKCLRAWQPVLINLLDRSISANCNHNFKAWKYEIAVLQRTLMCLLQIHMQWLSCLMLEFVSTHYLPYISQNTLLLKI